MSATVPRPTQTAPPRHDLHRSSRRTPELKSASASGGPRGTGSRRLPRSTRGTPSMSIAEPAADVDDSLTGAAAPTSGTTPQPAHPRPRAGHQRFVVSAPDAIAGSRTVNADTDTTPRCQPIADPVGTWRCQRVATPKPSALLAELSFASGHDQACGPGADSGFRTKAAELQRSPRLDRKARSQLRRKAKGHLLVGDIHADHVRAGAPRDGYKELRCAHDAVCVAFYFA